MCTAPKPSYSAPQPPVAAAAVAPTPPAPEPAPVRAAASAPTEASRSAQKAQSVLGQQRPPSSTVATSGRGILSAAETRQKRLLGQ